MTVLGTVLWIVGIGMILAGIAVGSASPMGGGALILAGLLLAAYTASRDYDASRTPMGRLRR